MQSCINHVDFWSSIKHEHWFPSYKNKNKNITNRIISRKQGITKKTEQEKSRDTAIVLEKKSIPFEKTNQISHQVVLVRACGLNTGKALKVGTVKLSYLTGGEWMERQRCAVERKEKKRLFKYSIQTIVQRYTCIANVLQNI
jgi:hypothetical protein